MGCRGLKSCLRTSGTSWDPKNDDIHTIDPLKYIFFKFFFLTLTWIKHTYWKVEEKILIYYFGSLSNDHSFRTSQTPWDPQKSVFPYSIKKVNFFKLKIIFFNFFFLTRTWIKYTYWKVEEKNLNLLFWFTYQRSYFVWISGRPGRPETHKKVFFIFHQERNFFKTQNHSLECSPT